VGLIAALLARLKRQRMVIEAIKPKRKRIHSWILLEILPSKNWSYSRHWRRTLINSSLLREKCRILPSNTRLSAMGRISGWSYAMERWFHECKIHSGCISYSIKSEEMRCSLDFLTKLDTNLFNCIMTDFKVLTSIMIYSDRCGPKEYQKFEDSYRRGNKKARI
jgi:hypothetical protein